MDARNVLNNGVEAVRVAPAVMARMVLHPRDMLMRMDHPNVPENMHLHHNLAPRSSACTSPSCELPVQESDFTLPIVLGVAVPCVIALIAFIFLYRRHQRKQRAEDLNDPHKSLDFGMGDVSGGVKTKKGLRASLGRLNVGEKNERPAHGRQMSLDMVSPYLLPPELQQSRESLHSLSRNIHQQEDPYRPVSQFIADSASRSGTPTGIRPRHDGSSIYTGSSGAPSRVRDNYAAELLPNAANISRTPSPFAPARQNSFPDSVTPGTITPATTVDSYTPPIKMPEPAAYITKQTPGSAAPANALPSDLRMNDQRPDSDLALSKSPPQLSSFRFSDDEPTFSNSEPRSPFMDPSEFDVPAPMPPVRSPERNQSQDESNGSGIRLSPPSSKTLPASPRPERKQSLPVQQIVEQTRLPPQPEAQTAWIEDASDYGEGFRVTPPSPGRDHAHLADPHSMDNGLSAPAMDNRRLSMGLRALPPTEITEIDDPEIRANRIRSFYKEYFDESKPAPQGQYYEDYDANYMSHGGYDDGNYYPDASYYDPDQNNFVMPYAQPVTRRAMTPPPQGRFMGQRPRQGSMGGMSTGGRGRMGPGPPRPPPGPRSHSAASNRMAPPSRLGARGRKLPPPAALNTLPTPSMLKDDSFALMGAIDFAPPLPLSERQRGRSESPFGERRPYSPSVPAYKPLATSYDDLPSMPSPHLLRRSGTFTGLDFAPPRKFKDPDTMSDAGSIRSNRSGVSAVQSEAIRRGAYRVSRLPGDQVFTKDDMRSVLKPQWGMRQNTN